MPVKTKDSVSFRRIVRVKRLLLELGYSSTFDALNDFKNFIHGKKSIKNKKCPACFWNKSGGNYCPECGYKFGSGGSY